MGEKKIQDNKEPILVAAAWPYANGSLHLGHVAALISADIIARYFRLAGHPTLFVSGSDCHGTPIAVEADRQGIPPIEIAEKYHQEFYETLVNGLGFSYDLYTTTTTDNHRKVVQEIFLKLYQEGNIYTKTEELPYCLACKRFLPDRYIEGECPICHFNDARGDQCDQCGNLMDSKQLISPRCKICGQPPGWRESEHFYLKLSAFQDQLKEWAKKSVGWRANAKNFTINFLEQGLHDRAITRDSDWGIPIPLQGYETKCIYVWFEAVCGYLSASKEYSRLQNQEGLWKSFWQNPAAKHYYVHGKDNIPFHTIIWPAILMGYGGLELPDTIISSEYLSLEGRQFSKSRHWAVWLPDFLANFDPETLRYYLVAGGPETADANFLWKEYQTKTNSELIGNFGNLVNRIFSFINVRFPTGVKLPQDIDEKGKEFLDLTKAAFAAVGQAIEKGKLREGLKTIWKIVEYGNRYVNDIAPWKTIKEDPAKTEMDLAVTATVIKNLAVLVSPYLPRTAERIYQMMGLKKIDGWDFVPAEKILIKEAAPLYKQIEDETVKKEMEKLGK